MGNHKKTQEGVFIALFALSTLVVISLAISFMSNTVTNLLAGQGQVMAGKQSYWLANSGVEVIAQAKLADLGSATKGDGTILGEVYNKHYSFAGGNIQVIGDNPAGAGYHNGLARTGIVTITGIIANSAHKIKWTLGTPDRKVYNFTFSAATIPKLTMIPAVSGIAVDADISISVWVNMDAIDERPLFGLDGNVDNHWIEFTSATVMDFKGNGGANPTLALTHGHTIETGSWQHIFIKRSSNTVTVYVNGLAGAGTNTWDAAFEPDAIGTNYNGSRKYFDGRITQLAIWTRVLDLTEIQSIYSQGYFFNLITDADGGVGVGLDLNLLHYWQLDKPTELTDSKGSNDLTKNNNSIQPTGI